MATLRTLLVNDHPRFLHALAHYLAGSARVSIVGQMLSLSEVPAQIMRLRLDMLLVGMPKAGKDVFTVIRQIKAQPDPPLVILLIPYDIVEYRRQARSAGADGCVVQSELANQLLPLIDTLCRDV